MGMFLSSLFMGLLTWAGPFSISHNKILIIGDSISEGYGVARELSYPALLEKKVQAKFSDQSGKSWKIINASVSGSTSASSLGRLKWQLKEPPQILILALGANDGLRGLKPESMYENLNSTIELATRNKIKIILAGMKAPPNYGAEYGRKFEQVYTDLSKKTDVVFIPFLLDKIAGDSKLNQSDGIHPNEKGHVVLSEMIYKTLEKEIEKLK
jgi:acyl-CoA thioesterase I